MSTTARLTVIVPYRQCRTGIRRRNLGVVLRHLSAMPVDVIVSEHDERPSLTGALPLSVRHVHVSASAGFSKSAACNAGFAASDAQVVAFLDADLLLDPAALVGSAARCRRDVDVVRPFGWLVDLDAEESADIASSGPCRR